LRHRRRWWPSVDKAHDPEKWKPVFRKDHAPAKNHSALGFEPTPAAFGTLVRHDNLIERNRRRHDIVTQPGPLAK
jgi:hypothetical protein